MQSASDICRNDYVNKEALQCYFSTHDSQSTQYRFNTAIYHYLLIVHMHWKQSAMQ